VDKVINANVNYFKMSMKHRWMHKTLLWTTSGPQAQCLRSSVLG